MSILGRTGVALTVCAGLVATGCGSDDDSSDDSGGSSGGTVTAVMSWFAEAEQGGYWQVEGSDLGQEVGGPTIDVEPGGPSVKVTPQVASGQFDYGMADADEVLLARSEGAPIVGIFNTFHTNFRCLMSQPEAGIGSIEDINGHPVSIAQGSVYWEYLKSEYDLSDVQEQNYTGTLDQLKQNPDLVQQCYITSEPYVAEQEGIPFETLLVAEETDWNPYQTMMVTTEDKIAESPDEVAKVVEAFSLGWEQYLANPDEAFKVIESENEEITRPELEFSFDEMQAMIQDPLGCMDPAAWEELAGLMSGAGLFGDDVDPSQAFTNEFVPNECEE